MPIASANLFLRRRDGPKGKPLAQSGLMRRSCPIGVLREKPLTQKVRVFGLINFLLCFYTYILKGLKDDGYYYGHCEERETRLKRHNTGKVRSTKSRRPFILHYAEKYSTKSEAAKREYFFKSIDGYKQLKGLGIIQDC